MTPPGRPGRVLLRSGFHRLGRTKRFAILDNFCLGLVEREVEGSIPGSGHIRKCPPTASAVLLLGFQRWLMFLQFPWGFTSPWAHPAAILSTSITAALNPP